MSYKNTYNRWALGVSTFALSGALSGCATTMLPNTDTCMQASSVNALLVGFGGTSYNTACNDGRVAFALMTRADDPVGNALGFMLYMDQNPEAKKMLEGRLGGKDKVKIADTTVAGLLLSEDETSRSIGAQIYVMADEKTRGSINEILKTNNVDPRQHVAANLDQGVHAAAKAWARDHAAAPAGVDAETTYKNGNYRKAETDKGVVFTFKKAKPAGAAATP